MIRNKKANQRFPCFHFLGILKMKRGEKIFSFFWIVLLIIIGIVFALGIGIVYSTDFNVSGKEANILYDRLYDCVVNQGFVDANFVSGNFDFFSKCGLSKNVFEKEIFSFKIFLYNYEGEEMKVFSEGKKNVGELCSSNWEENSIGCFDKKTIVLYDEDGESKKAYLRILTMAQNSGGDE